ncbi:MAG: tetratricopeptide repeat protein [Candidatus Rifleibacteriota bacterium]
MITIKRFNKFVFCLISIFVFSVLFNNASSAMKGVARNFCHDCKILTKPDAVRCPQCDKPLNPCLECGYLNPVNLDFCEKCNLPLAEMRVLNSIDPETRKKLKLGKSDRAVLERELNKLNNLIEKNPENLERLLFRKGKILHMMEFHSREAMLWKEYLKLYPKTAKKSFIQIYLSEALRKWGYLFYKQQNKKQAAKLFIDATEANPLNSKAWQWLGRIKMEQNQNQQAANAYLEALKIEPGNNEIIHFLRKLKKPVPEKLLKSKNNN